MKRKEVMGRKEKETERREGETSKRNKKHKEKNCLENKTNGKAQLKGKRGFLKQRKERSNFWLLKLRLQIY